MKKTVKNKFEDRIFKLLKKNRINVAYESEKISYLLAGHYIPDFVITLADGSRIYIETKGYLRPEHKRKMAAVKKLHPTIDLRILFYSYKEKDIKWAKKLGLKYAINTIPDDWFHELLRSP